MPFDELQRQEWEPHAFRSPEAGAAPVRGFLEPRMFIANGNWNWTVTFGLLNNRPPTVGGVTLGDGASDEDWGQSLHPVGAMGYDGWIVAHIVWEGQPPNNDAGFIPTVYERKVEYVMGDLPDNTWQDTYVVLARMRWVNTGGQWRPSLHVCNSENVEVTVNGGAAIRWGWGGRADPDLEMRLSRLETLAAAAAEEAT